MKKGKFNIVFGGQAGSEAKGKLSGWLVDKQGVDAIVMTSSPNAGHTIVLPDGTKKVSYHLPVSATMCDSPILLTAASLINFDTFEREIADLGIDPSRIYLDPRASIIKPYHIETEEKNGKSDIGSTLQGIGECRISKMMRRGEGHHLLAGHIKGEFRSIGVELLDTDSSKEINWALDNGWKILCESTQGFDLDLEHGIDPVYCTSKMINPSMIAAEAGVAPSMVGDTWAVIRPYPIRVNNRTGTSGPYGESKEIDWPDVENRCGHPASYGMRKKPEERLQEVTTTTKLPRRVFEFNWIRYKSMLQVCRPTAVCLQFANYLDWSVYGETERKKLTPKVVEFVQRLESYGVPVKFIGTGPGHDEMIEVPDMGTNI